MEIEPSNHVHLTEHRDDEGQRMGMWIFLFTEVILFGGLFLVYAVYRNMHPVDFHEGSIKLNVVIGAINTIILLTSSYFVAMAVSSMQKGKVKQARTLLLLTILCAIIFLVNKFFEWQTKFHHGLFPGMEEFYKLSHGESLFFILYFFMTGLHGVHVIVGAVFIGFILRYIKKGKVNPVRYTLLENSGLYWHLVDIIWIFLFPLFYLII
ncbi:MAG: cytochrome c oxidase subunit 3 family protein [Bacteroidia bacterium]|nr:cytochrome c oxidase subunit 3 family protein [Bacteroidia bacterium]